jgi:spoIIIJ-associated protein
MKNAINSFVLSLEEEQKKTEIKEKKVSETELREGERQKQKTYEEEIKYIEDVVKKIIEMICPGQNIGIRYIQENVMIEVTGKELAAAIGKNGRNIEAVEHIINLIGRRRKITNKRIILDINDYRKRNIEKLNKLAINMAEKAVKEGRKISLKPMPSYERKLIHNLLSTKKEVKTRSSNEEPNRRIIIYPVENKN